MPQAHPIPNGLVCASCKYDLAGLRWGVACPECGYQAPRNWPTDDLREAHPEFIRSNRTQLRGLIIADAMLLAGLGIMMAAYFLAISSFPLSDNEWVVYTAWVLGVGALLLGLLVVVIMSGWISRIHPKARDGLDQPLRKGFSRSFWWSVGPFGGALLLTIVTNGAGGCVLLIAIPISFAACGVLAYALFEHDTSLIKRCKIDPSWTLPQSLLGYGSIPMFLLFAVSITLFVEATFPLVITGFAMLVLTHLLRTRIAERCVRRIHAEIHEPIDPPATSANPPPVPPRS